jgi:hypothetical protein
MLKRCILALAFCLGSSASLGQQSANCGDAVSQIAESAKFVGTTNYAFQLRRGSGVYLILFLQQPVPGTDRLRWRLIERIGETLNYCVRAQGKHFTPLMSVHLGNPAGKYGMPGSGFPRCAGKQTSGLPGSLDIRLWANRELGQSTVYALESEDQGRNYVFLTSIDNVGAWILLDNAQGNLDDTCYYSRGDASDVRENVKVR